jgi:hypothetical protein
VAPSNPSADPHPNPTTPLPLQDLVAGIDAALAGRQGAELLRVTGDPPEVARRPLDHHPLDLLLGFTAPQDWLALGVHCHGRARRLHPHQPASVDDSKPSARPAGVMLTMLIDRAGRGAGTLREGEVVTQLPGPPEGVVGDACRRALGLPTAPPPGSTVELWFSIWLDRLVDTIAILGHPERYHTWQAIASLHPAVGGPNHRAQCAPTIPRTPASLPSRGSITLADATRRLAEAWPWSRLRAEPEVVDTPAPPLAAEITRWMDDGMYARWVLSEMPAMDDLSSAVDALLPASLCAAVAQTVVAAGASWPQCGQEA